MLLGVSKQVPGSAITISGVLFSWLLVTVLVGVGIGRYRLDKERGKSTSSMILYLIIASLLTVPLALISTVEFFIG